MRLSTFFRYSCKRIIFFPLEALVYFFIDLIILSLALAVLRANLHCPTPAPTAVSHGSREEIKLQISFFYRVILQTFGIALGLSDAILGLTFLAWGNSLGGEYRLNLLLEERHDYATVLFFSVSFSQFLLPLFPPASLVLLRARRTKRKEELLIDMS